ncbi:MAG: Fic family protein, partial [Azoarcus sp.]|nr:Fic family protein [Azoarcus sp.]
MNQTANAGEFEAILAVVAERPEGIGISGLHEALAARGGPLNRRTLQRRVAHLVRGGRLIGEGRSVARVYKVRAPVLYAPPTAVARVAAEPEGVYELYVPVSDEGASVRALVRQPLARRGLVGYDRDLLEHYEPGVSQYLPDAIRLQLHEIGRTAAAGQPAGTHARSILERLLVDLSWASSRLEGNTYTRRDVQRLIASGTAAGDKDILEAQMILNHKAAVEMLVEDIDEIGLDILTFRNLHAVLSQNLLHDDAASGRLRRRPLEISGTVFQPSALPQFIESSFRLLLDKARAISDPFEQAFFLMVQIPYLQPFVDVNKRVSRLGANIPLLKRNLCPLSFVDVPGIAYTEGTLGV